MVKFLPKKAPAPPVKTDPFQPLPDNIVNAWKEAGAEVDWVRVSSVPGFAIVPGRANALPFDNGQPRLMR